MKITSGQQASTILHTVRRLAGYSRPGLARRLHVSLSTVHNREEQRRGLTIDALVATADVFGLDVVLVRRDTGKPA